MVSDRRAINRANAERGAQVKFWADPRRSTVLRELWRQGRFAGEIAAIIGNGCTKNMVIRRAKTLRLPKRSPGEFARRALLIRVPCETNEGRAV